MIWMIGVLVLFFSSCQQEAQETHYKEIVIQAPPSTEPISPDVKENRWRWSVPKGWQEIPAQGMRLASFSLIDDPKAMDCSIVSLGAMAGGLPANLSRWLGQLGLEASTDHLKELMHTAQQVRTKDGLEGQVFDFSMIQPEAVLSDTSMMAAMIKFNEATIFVKMTASIESIRQHRNEFFNLVASISRK